MSKQPIIDDQIISAKGYNKITLGYDEKVRNQWAIFGSFFWLLILLVTFTTHYIKGFESHFFWFYAIWSMVLEQYIDTEVEKNTQ